jgi:hypothetical protein
MVREGGVLRLTEIDRLTLWSQVSFVLHQAGRDRHQFLLDGQVQVMDRPAQERQGALGL